MSTSTSAEQGSSPIEGPIERPIERPRRREPEFRPTSPGRRPSAVRLATWCTAAALVAAVLLTVTILGLTAFGYRALAIRSGSMTPALHTGDLVVSRSELASRIQPGDVVTFHAPSLGGALVTHRVVSATRSAGVINVVTKGDANTVSEAWSVGASGQVGLAVAHVRFAGWWFAALETGTGRVLLVCLACLWVAVVVVPRIWASS